MLFLRALLAFLALPVMVAFVTPWVALLPIDRWRVPGMWFGWVPAVSGTALLLWCVRDFYVHGKGTLAPWSPPRTLVRTGAYRFSRNPMYVAVAATVAGWALLAGSPVLALYAALLAVAFCVRVVRYEEPWLREQFPSDWLDYSRRVNRWIPSLRDYDFLR